MARLYAIRPVSVLLAAVLASNAVRAEDLAQAWRAALAADKRLRAARSVTDSAAETLAAAQASRLPSLTLESGYTALNEAPAVKVDLPPLPATQLPLADDKSVSYKARVAVPVYTSGRISRRIDAARAGLGAVQADEARTAADLKLEVARSYVNALRTEHGVAVAEQNVTSLEAHARDVANLFKKGLVARNNLLAAQVALADARQRAIQARNKRDLAHAAYNRLLGRRLTEPVHVDDLAPGPIEASVEALTARALDQRAELSILAERENALRHQSAAERAAANPQVSVSADYSFIENPYQVHEGLWSATLGLRWDIFDGGVIRHRSGATVRRAEAVRNQREDAVTRIALQVRQSWLDATEAQERIGVTRQALAESEESLKVARDRYREGLGTNTEVLDAEAQRTLTYSNYNNAIYDAVLAELRLRYAVGEL